LRRLPLYPGSSRIQVWKASACSFCQGFTHSKCRVPRKNDFACAAILNGCAALFYTGMFQKNGVAGVSLGMSLLCTWLAMWSRIFQLLSDSGIFLYYR
jgi:hypothetical protein